MKRPSFLSRTIRLVGESQRAAAIKAIEGAPLDLDKPLEVVLREEKKVRGLDMNAAMWAGPLRDIAEQAWVDGRQFSAEVWHEWAKREFLPELDHPDLAELVKDGYRKWDVDPSGNRVLVGSTTQLTRKGFHWYLQQVEAHGASLGVHYRAREAA